MAAHAKAGHACMQGLAARTGRQGLVGRHAADCHRIGLKYTAAGQQHGNSLHFCHGMPAGRTRRSSTGQIGRRSGVHNRSVSSRCGAAFVGVTLHAEALTGCTHYASHAAPCRSMVMWSPSPKAAALTPQKYPACQWEAASANADTGRLLRWSALHAVMLDCPYQYGNKLAKRASDAECLTSSLMLKAAMPPADTTILHRNSPRPNAAPAL